MAANEPISERDLQLNEVIGTGTFGVVHKGRYKGELCAIKILRYLPKNDENIKREIDNLTILTEFNHENIIKLINITSIADEISLVLEYMSGGTLSAYLHNEGSNINLIPRNQRFTKLIKLLCQAAKALEFLHKRNIAHRDVKPKNYLLDKEGKVLKLCDFGYSKELTSYNTSNIGSPCYKAPEVLQGEVYTCKCDVFSLAITMWETVTQTIPFPNYNTANLIDDVLKKDMRPPDVNKITIDCEELNKLIKECWEKQPDDRPTMAKIVQSLQSIDSQFS